MIGDTHELLDAVKAASQEGASCIRTRENREFVRRFVRMNISPRQTDTLLAITSRSVWTGVTPTEHQWPLLGDASPRRGVGRGVQETHSARFRPRARE
jgi:hypothetical protein